MPLWAPLPTHLLSIAAYPCRHGQLLKEHNLSLSRTGLQNGSTVFLQVLLLVLWTPIPFTPANTAL